MNEFSRPPTVHRPATQAADGLPRLSWSVEEFDKLGELGFFTENDRIELIGGELLPMSPKGNRHEVVRGELALRLARALPADIKVYVEPGWRADASHYFEPDILVFPESRSLGTLAAPDVLLLIEVAHSSSKYDLELKAKVFSSLGVREYWVVNAKTLETTVHLEPGEQGYRDVSNHGPNEMLVARALPELGVQLGALKIE